MKLSCSCWKFPTGIYIAMLFKTDDMHVILSLHYSKYQDQLNFVKTFDMYTSIFINATDADRKLCNNKNSFLQNQLSGIHDIWFEAK